MPAQRCRTSVTCPTCGKVFTMQTGDYKKKLALNIGGRIFCSPACYYTDRRVRV